MGGAARVERRPAGRARGIGGGLEGGDGASLWRPEHPGSVRDGMIQLAAAEDWGGAPPKADKGTDDKGTDDWGQGAPEPEAPEDKRTPIRYYESIGLLPAPARIGGQRRYGPEALPRLALIAAARQMGFTLAEIATLLHGFEDGTPAPARWRVLAAAKLVEVQALRARAEWMERRLGEALRCDCHSLDACPHALQGAAVPDSGGRC